VTSWATLLETTGFEAAGTTVVSTWSAGFEAATGTTGTVEATGTPGTGGLKLATGVSRAVETTGATVLEAVLATLLETIRRTTMRGSRLEPVGGTVETARRRTVETIGRSGRSAHRRTIEAVGRSGRSAHRRTVEAIRTLFTARVESGRGRVVPPGRTTTERVIVIGATGQVAEALTVVGTQMPEALTVVLDRRAIATPARRRFATPRRRWRSRRLGMHTVPFPWWRRHLSPHRSVTHVARHIARRRHVPGRHVTRRHIARRRHVPGRRQVTRRHIARRHVTRRHVAGVTVRHLAGRPHVPRIVSPGIDVSWSIHELR